MKSIIFLLLTVTSVIMADAAIKTTSVDLEIIDYTFNLDLDKAFALSRAETSISSEEA